MTLSTQAAEEIEKLIAKDSEISAGAGAQYSFDVEQVASIIAKVTGCDKAAELIKLGLPAVEVMAETFHKQFHRPSRPLNNAAKQMRAFLSRIQPTKKE